MLGIGILNGTGGVFLKNHVDRFLDIRGCVSPIIFLKACQAFRAMKRGDTIEILVSESNVAEDLFKILPVSAYDIVNVREEGSVSIILAKT